MKLNKSFFALFFNVDNSESTCAIFCLLHSEIEVVISACIAKVVGFLADEDHVEA